MKTRILEFKTISPFFEMCRDDQKPFDIRLWDNDDPRFKTLSRSMWPRGVVIKFTNPVTSESFTRMLITWDFMNGWDCQEIKPAWIIMHLGKLVKPTNP